MKKYSLSFFREKTENIYGFYRRKTITSTLIEEKVEYTIERKEKLLIQDNTLLGINNPETKKEKEKKEKKIKKRKNEKQKATQMIYRLYIALYYILHYYWIIIFMFIFVIVFHWMLSISMSIQLFLFCFYIGKSFKVYYNYYNKISSTNDEVKQIKQKINRHIEEGLEIFKTTSETHQEYFKYLRFFYIFSY